MKPTPDEVLIAWGNPYEKSEADLPSRGELAEALREAIAQRDALVSIGYANAKSKELNLLCNAVNDMLQYPYAGKRHPLKKDLDRLGSLVDEIRS